MELVLIRLSASHAMMRKSSHQVGFLEAANRKLLFSSRRSGDRMYEDRISPLKANAWGCVADRLAGNYRMLPNGITLATVLVSPAGRAISG
jgi:hypothetical protein